MTVTNIVMRPPDADEPGFLRRAIQAADFVEQIQAKKVTAQLMRDMVEFLLPYVKVPEDREAARNAILDASENQFEQLVSLIGGTAESTIPLASETPSSSTTSPEGS